MTDSDVLFWLVISRVSTRKINALLSVYPPQVLYEEFNREEAFEKLVGEKCFLELKKYRKESFLDRCKEALTKRNIGYITLFDKEYPLRLNQKEVVPPPVLFYCGDISIISGQTLAVVGTRNSSKYGKEVTERLVPELVGGGFTIVSGLATGIDAFAHLAALNSNGKTIAVLGSGLEKMSPMANYSLFREICERGLVLSEYLPNVEATPYTFPERNRIISGLSQGVLCIEASEKSGALITCNYALEQGRDVFVVPGNITQEKSKGTNMLIKRGGAILVTDASDILEEYKMESAKITQNIAAIQLDICEEKLYNTLQSGQKSFDELVIETGMMPSEVSGALFTLELGKLIWQPKTNIYERK